MASMPTAYVVCPECQEAIPVEIHVMLVNPEDGSYVVMVCEPDMTDLWAHVWAHDG